MFTHIKDTFLLLFFILFSLYSTAQSSADSLYQEHRILLDDYSRSKSAMDERTWIKLVELSQQADTLIKTDKILVEYYLNNELKKNQELIKEIEYLKMEMSAIEKESKVQQMILDEQHFLNKALLIGLVATGVLFILFLILFIDRQNRNSHLKMELQHSWAKTEEDPSQQLQQEQLETLQQQLENARQKKEGLQKEIKDHLLKEEKLEQQLQDEKANRKRVEREIKSLIEQLT